MAQAEGCPIESNIKSTKGQNVDNTMDISDDYNDSNDAAFDEEDGDDIMGGDDDWGSIHSDNQQMPQNKANDYGIKMIGAHEENPFEEGNEAVKVIENGGRPVFDNDPKQKCWLCDVCHAINNLLESMKKYNYKCCVCGARYGTKAAIIFSNEWDGVNENNPQESIWTVWNCPFCTLKNDIGWHKCDGCDCDRPGQGYFEISYTYIKPKRVNERYNERYNEYKKPNKEVAIAIEQKNNDKNKNKNKNIVRHHEPRIGNIGVARKIYEYPASSVLTDRLESRLVNIFGTPYRNKLLMNKKKRKAKWNAYCIEYSCPYIPSTKFAREEIVGRGFAINSRTGWIATMSTDHIWVFACSGGREYRLVAEYTFGSEQRLIGQDVANSRIRFVGNNAIFVWSFSRSRVYSFKLYSNSLILLDVIRDKYLRDSQTMDIAVCNDLLILLFDRWCGVYKLYPKFEWYHAVAFATKTVNCFSLEIVDYDGDSDGDADEMDDKLMRKTNRNYLWINAEDQLIGIHPSNPTFDFVHCAKDTKHSLSKYCISKYYGVFYVSNDAQSLHQSPHLDYASNVKLFDASACGIKMFYNLSYDEMYGISGRLLVIAQSTNDEADEHILQQFINENEMDLFKTELNQLPEAIPGMQSQQQEFNLIVAIYKMLYGNDFIDAIIVQHRKEHETFDAPIYPMEGVHQ